MQTQTLKRYLLLFTLLFCAPLFAGTLSMSSANLNLSGTYLGTDVYLSGSSSFKNTGTVEATNTVTIDAAGEFDNKKGTIKGKNVVINAPVIKSANDSRLGTIYATKFYLNGTKIK